MAISDALKKMRGSDYDTDEKKDEGSKGVRVIKLSEEEAKSLEQVPDGQDVQCDVRAKKEGDHLHVMSVQYTGGGEGEQDMDEMAAKVAGVQAPMMRSQTSPSPS